MENKIFMTFNKEGFLTGCYNSNVYDPPEEGQDRNPRIPAEAIEMTQEQADEIFGLQGLRKFINGEVVIHTPPTPPEPVPPIISDRQFAQQLAKMGLITNEEALAWVRAGVVPAAFDAFVQSLPEAQQFDAEMLLSGATQFDRDHQLTETFGAARGMTPEQIDQLWRDAAAL